MTTTDPVCLACVAWIGSLGHAVTDDLTVIAADRGTTIPEARRLLLAAYHDHHHQEELWTGNESPQTNPHA